MSDTPSNSSLPAAAHSQKLEYESAEERTEGALTELPGKLSTVMQFDQMDLEGVPNSKRVRMWFRQGAKRIFHIKLIRKSGRYIVEMGGINPGQVLDGISVCRDHFDRWFGITPRDITLYERQKQMNRQDAKVAKKE